MHSFYDFNYVLRLPIKNLPRLIHKAFEKKEEKKAWDMWISRYPNMSKDDFEPFSQFLKRLKQPQIPKKANETVEETFERFKSKVKKK